MAEQLIIYFSVGLLWGLFALKLQHIRHPYVEKHKRVAVFVFNTIGWFICIPLTTIVELRRYARIKGIYKLTIDVLTGAICACAVIIIVFSIVWIVI